MTETNDYSQEAAMNVTVAELNRELAGEGFLWDSQQDIWLDPQDDELYATVTEGPYKEGVLYFHKFTETTQA